MQQKYQTTKKKKKERKQNLFQKKKLEWISKVISVSGNSMIRLQQKDTGALLPKKEKNGVHQFNQCTVEFTEWKSVE